MIVGDKAAEATLKYRPLTLFAPTNRAFQNFGTNRTSILYHMCKCKSISGINVRPSSFTTENNIL